MKYKPLIKETRLPENFEEELIRKWEEENIYEFHEDSEKPVFTIDTPPPYTSGRWHLGAAAHYAQIDMVARAYRMLGYNVLVPFYCDRNGLPVEVQVEKKYGIRAKDVPREEFLRLCKEFIDKVEEELVYIVKRMGFSFQYWRDGTDSEKYRTLTQLTFIELYKRGLIYEDLRPNNFCTRCNTTLADAELEYKTVDAYLYYIKFKVKETGEDIIIATTRPELLCTCALVIFNPEDERYKRLEGKHAIVPIFGQEVEIRAHPAARPEFGTGLVMICSFGDLTDVRIFRELGLKYKIAINPDGKMNEVAGKYAGLTVKEAREKIAEDLEKESLLVEKKPIKHEIPVCWRCGTPIEFIAMPEYYLKQVEFKEELLKLADQMVFYPPEAKEILVNWIKSITADWPISRRRYYGTEIPIWYCKKCGTPHVPEPGKYYRPWAEKAPFEKCSKCGCTEFVGEERVFDTWMDSSNTPLYVCGYYYRKDFFEKNYPCSLRPQGKDIVRTWLYYTMLKSYLLTGKPPFKYVRITGMGLDEKGEKMSKSKGNIIDPIPIVEKYGADAVRFWSAAEAKLGSDYRYSEHHVATGRAFVVKLWNIARFISQFPKCEKPSKIVPLDLMILGELNNLIRKCVDAYKEMDVFLPANEIYSFTWKVFAAHYIEAVKQRAYNLEGIFSEEEQKSAWYTLHTVLEAILKLLAPICPFITDYIWRKLYKETSIHIELFPEPVPEHDTEYVKALELFMEFNSSIWKYKKDKGLSLKEPLQLTVYMPKELEPFIKDLKAMHRIKELKVGVPENKDLFEVIGPNMYVEKSQ
ncbi:MAG: valine--tRNA ligase [Thermoprotei archaeon]|nr:MAG: valine--tRNA ligase [Thermoprotei archaeon]